MIRARGRMIVGGGGGQYKLLVADFIERIMLGDSLFTRKGNVEFVETIQTSDKFNVSKATKIIDVTDGMSVDDYSGGGIRGLLYFYETAGNHLVEIPENAISMDVFLCGAGGDGGPTYGNAVSEGGKFIGGGGGGGGYTKTILNIPINKDDTISLIVGKGGGGSSSLTINNVTYTAEGGKTGNADTEESAANSGIGGDGGSGGGTGGINGSGNAGATNGANATGGKGQGSPTVDFLGNICGNGGGGGGGYGTSNKGGNGGGTEGGVGGSTVAKASGGQNGSAGSFANSGGGGAYGYYPATENSNPSNVTQYTGGGGGGAGYGGGGGGAGYGGRRRAVSPYWGEQIQGGTGGNGVVEIRFKLKIS